MEIETRKVQVTGGSTYIVSLPKKWINKVKIKSGDGIALIPRSDGTLLINPKLSKKQEELTRSITIDYSQDTETLVREFIGVYLAGYDVIEIKSKEKLSPAIRQKIRRLSYSVIGPEIIDETSNSVTVKDLLDASDFSLVKGVKRMYLIAKSMHRDAIIALNNQDIELMEDVESRDDEVDKFYWMIAKQYNLVLKDVFFADKMGITPQEALGYLLVARSIERIADHAKKLASNAKNVRGNLAIIPKITEASDAIIEVLDGAINAFYRNKFEYANEVVDKSKSLAETTEKLTREILALKGDAATIVSIAYIVDSLERTRAYVLDIAETSINHYFVTESNVR
jgi:phosphate uptake regulator